MAIVVGLNFDRFVAYGDAAVYYLSGQAGRDVEAKAAADRERDARYQLQRAEGEKVLAQMQRDREALAVRAKIILAAWAGFLSDERTLDLRADRAILPPRIHKAPPLLEQITATVSGFRFIVDGRRHVPEPFQPHHGGN